jgi:hypothetical protein
LGTITAGPIKAARRGIDTSTEGVTALLDRANSTDVAERAAVAQMLGALLADAERALPGSRAEGLPTDAIHTTLAMLLSDHDWRVRARAMVAVGWSRLESRVTVAAAPGVRREENPIVKLLAVRLFARHHGEKFVQVLEQLSKTDPSHFVRTMAASFLPEPPRVQANRTVIQSEAPVP